MSGAWGMTGGQDTNKLVAEAFSAAGNEQLFSEFLGHYSDYVGSDGVWLSHVDEVGCPSLVAAPGFDRATLERYEHGFANRNPYVTRVVRILGQGPQTTEKLLSHRDFMRTEFYADFVRTEGWSRWATIAVLGDKASVWGVNCQWRTAPSRKAFEASLERQVQVFTFLASAIQLHARLLGLARRSLDLSSALDATGTAMCLCDSQGRVLYSSEQASNIFRDLDGLSVVEGRLKCNDCGASRALAQACRNAAQLADGKPAIAPTVVHVARATRSSLRVLVAPLAEKHGAWRSPGGRALVFLEDPESTPSLRHQLLQELYGLTGREANAAMLLATGQSTAQITSTLAIGRETLKSYLKSLYDKTNTNRQAQLVAALLSGLATLLPTQQRVVRGTKPGHV